VVPDGGDWRADSVNESEEVRTGRRLQLKSMAGGPVPPLNIVAGGIGKSKQRVAVAGTARGTASVHRAK